jgi:hypothetical protein
MKDRFDIGWLNDEYVLIPTICLNFKYKIHSFQFLKFVIDFNY